MALGPPDGVVIEVEFTPGTWVDVSEWVDWSQPCTTTFGRQSVFSAVQPSTMTFALDNADGRFTPRRQTLVDGTPHPYWPNVLPRRRVRRRLITAAQPAGYTRFVGYVKGWPTGFKGTRLRRVTVTAEDRLTRLSRVTMTSPLRYEVMADSPSMYYPLTDDGSDQTATDATGNNPALKEDATTTSSTAPPVVQWATATGPSPEDGTVPRFQPSTVDQSTDLLTAGLPLRVDRRGAATIEVWLRAIKPASGTLPTNPQVPVTLWTSDLSQLIVLQVTTAGLLQVVADTTRTLSSTSIVDSVWHHVAVVFAGSGSSGTVYLDGVSVGTITSAPTVFGLLILGNAIFAGNGSGFNGNLAHVAVYPSALSAARVARHYLMGNLRNELVSDRIARFLGYAGIPAADMSLDVSTVQCAVTAQNGQDVVTGCQELSVDTEGAGSFFYVNPPGLIRFAARASDVPASPMMTLDAAGDLSGDDYSPTFGDDELLNSVTGSRVSFAGSRQTATQSDPLSIAMFDLFSSDFGSHAQSLTDVVYNAQDRVARYSQPTFRLDQLTVDLRTATTAGLYDALGTLELGDRVRVTNLDAAAAPRAQLDLIVQGGTETISDLAYTLTLMTSAADTPAPMVADDLSYGRAQCSGQTLQAGIGAASASLAIATAAGLPTLTTAAGDYPLTIVIGAEHLTLTGPPDGSASPQTFTGVTRGVDGTLAAAQPGGSSIDLTPTSTATL